MLSVCQYLNFRSTWSEAIKFCTSLLHFTWVIDDMKMWNVYWSRVSLSLCVFLSVAACPRYCTDPDVTWGNGSGFAIGAWLSLLWHHSANAKCQRALVLALCLVSDCWSEPIIIDPQIEAGPQVQARYQCCHVGPGCCACFGMYAHVISCSHFLHSTISQSSVWTTVHNIPDTDTSKKWLKSVLFDHAFQLLLYGTPGHCKFFYYWIWT